MEMLSGLKQTEWAVEKLLFVVDILIAYSLFAKY